MAMPPNLYSIRLEDIRKGLEIYTDNLDQGLGMTRYQVIEVKNVKNQVLILECINMDLNVNQTIKFNLKYPGAVYTAKVQSEWRRG